MLRDKFLVQCEKINYEMTQLSSKIMFSSLTLIHCDLKALVFFSTGLTSMVKYDPYAELDFLFASPDAGK